MQISVLRSVSFRLSFAVIAPTTHVSCFEDGMKLDLVSRATIQQRLEAGKTTGKDREHKMVEVFHQAGCETTLERVDRRSSNVICTLPGETTQLLLVSGHFDFADEGEGIVDDWTGASLLASLYQTLKSNHQRHTYQFVAFTGEETGLSGSNRYVNEMSKRDMPKPEALINLECLGVTSPKVWSSRANQLLLNLLGAVANAAKIPLQGVNVDQVGDDDSHPFMDRKIPVITIHSLTQETWPILHTSRDNLKAVNAEQYYATYRLIAFYLKYLDTSFGNTK